MIVHVGFAGPTVFLPSTDRRTGIFAMFGTRGTMKALIVVALMFTHFSPSNFISLIFQNLHMTESEALFVHH